MSQNPLDTKAAPPEPYRDRFWTDPRAALQPSATAGQGLFAALPFHAGEIVEIMGGITLTEEAFRRFQANATRDGRAYNAMQIGENLHLVEPPEITSTRQGSINHSCDPNLWMGDEVTVIARRDIAAGEELTVDYALCSAQPDWSLDQPCGCNSSLCRGTITGNDWQLPELQARYRGHFAPFLNTRITRLSGD